MILIYLISTIHVLLQASTELLVKIIGIMDSHILDTASLLMNEPAVCVASAIFTCTCSLFIDFFIVLHVHVCLCLYIVRYNFFFNFRAYCTLYLCILYSVHVLECFKCTRTVEFQH